MTAQISDDFFFHDNWFDISGISEGELFDPASLNLNPIGACTACYRGYQAHFGIIRNKLKLLDLKVNLYKEIEGYEYLEGPVINGVKPEYTENSFFNNNYDCINHDIPFTGGLLLGSGFIQDLYVHMGFHPAWKYETVFELTFENGILSQEFDRSERIAEIRKLIIEQGETEKPNKKSSNQEIVEFIESSFDRSYAGLKSLF